MMHYRMHTLFFTPGVDCNFSHLTFETMTVIGYLFRHQKLIDQSNHFTLGRSLGPQKVIHLVIVTIGPGPNKDHKKLSKLLFQGP
jgi:hypothetical protein